MGRDAWGTRVPTSFDAPRNARPQSLVETLDWCGISREFKLSSRESEVAQALVAGHTLQDTARLMNLGLGTVKTYCQRMYRKVEVSSHQGLTMAVITAHMHLLQGRTSGAHDNARHELK